MAPIKFEENIKSKLDERTIKPSPAAWERISQKLDASDQKKKRNRLAPWLIAASISAILILAGTVFFGGRQMQPLENQLVNTPVDTVEQEVKQVVPKNKIIEEKVVEKTPVVESYAAAEKVDNASAKAIKTTPNSAIQKPKSDATSTTDAVALNDKEQAEKVIDPEKSPAFENALDAKVAQLLAEVEAMAKADRDVSQNDIDALLRGAQRELTQERIFQTPSKDLSALALLQEVEGELDQSFRDKVFDELSKRFSQAREAIASRNN